LIQWTCRHLPIQTTAADFQRVSEGAVSPEKTQYNRRVSIGDLLTERSDNAAMDGFGEGTIMYDNVLVLGEVKVGRHTWIGPGCILDGSGGGLEVGDFCSISSGVQIYTHHTVKRSVSLGVEPVDYAPTKIGNDVYIGPNAVIQMAWPSEIKYHRREFVCEPWHPNGFEGLWHTCADTMTQ
jgi:UDP-3-O-[3-hydroxymyristoyl] glucosamine N-acyltransferase